MEEVIFHSEARAELLEAAAYYDGCRPGLGREFLEAAEAVVRLAQLHPKAGRVIRSPYRRFLVRRFPYGIVYREHEATVFVAAVVHLHRKPGYWGTRIESENR